MEGRKKMEKKKTFRPVPGLSREEEEKQLEEILEVAQENLERTKGYMKQLSEELHDLIETYGPKDKQALALLHNTQSRLQENKRDLIKMIVDHATDVHGLEDRRLAPAVLMERVEAHITETEDR